MSQVGGMISSRSRREELYAASPQKRGSVDTP